MRIGYLECFSGIAGDMFLGALCDAGVNPRLLQEAADALGLGVRLEFGRVDRSGIQSTKVRVLLNGQEADGGLSEESRTSVPSHADTHSHTHVSADGSIVTHSHSHAHTEASHAHTHTHADGTVHSHSHTDSAHAHDEGHTHTHEHEHAHRHGRGLTEILTLIRGAAISAETKRIAVAAFEHLGRAEAKIHGVPLETIHFHEVGAVDAIIDIVCGAAGAASLGLEQWFCSPVNTGSGFVNCAHGRFPVPAPATAELLTGIPVYAEGPAKEMTTPTGAALLLALGCSFDAVPAMKTTATGYGAGTRNPDGFPNVLRLRVGDTLAADQQRTSFAGLTAENDSSDQVTILECAIDDATPEVLAYATQELLEHGALDVMQQPAMMKKGRQGTLLTVLCARDRASMLEELLFRETTTLGVRSREERRSILERRIVFIETAFGIVRVKLGIREGHVWNAAPEFEDCREAAQRHGAALKDVMLAAITAWHQQSEQVSSAAEVLR